MAVSGHLLYWTTGLNSFMPDKFRHECAGADTRDGTQPPCNFETAFFPSYKLHPLTWQHVTSRKARSCWPQSEASPVVWCSTWLAA